MICLNLNHGRNAETTVIEILPGKVKFSGMMAALLLKDKSGHIFRTGFSDSERRNPPPPGSVITFKFTGTPKKGLPRFASFMRMSQR